MEVGIISPDKIDDYWDAIQPLMQSFYERAEGRYEPEDIRELLKNNSFTLWAVVHNRELKSIVMNSIVQYPRLKELQIFMCAGDGYKDWVGLVETIAQYGRDMGCTKITALTRLGWDKILSNLGFKKTHIYLERNL
jgi:hypothetical protein